MTGRATIGRANRRRGEIEAVLDGERRILCLTLGALAELETAFAVDNLDSLAARFAHGRLGASDIIRILGAGLRGGGNLFSDEDVAAMAAEGGLAGAAKAVAELLVATFGTDEAAGGEGRDRGGRTGEPRTGQTELREAAAGQGGAPAACAEREPVATPGPGPTEGGGDARANPPPAHPGR